MKKLIPLFLLLCVTTNSYSESQPAANDIFSTETVEKQNAKESVKENLSKAFIVARSKCWIDIADFRQSLAHGWAITNDTSNITPISLENSQSVLQGNGENSILPADLKYPKDDKKYGRPDWLAMIKSGENMIHRINEKRCYIPATACVEPNYQHLMSVMSETEGARWARGKDELDIFMSSVNLAKLVIETCNTSDSSFPEEPIKPMIASTEINNDALFAFDSAIVTDRGYKVAERLAKGILKLKLDAPMVQIIGHTDSLGSSAYNYNLSIRRAIAFKKVLEQFIGNDIVIKTIGKGETQPSAKTSQCNDSESSENISCLAPDRRVQIKVFGKKI